MKKIINFSKAFVPCAIFSVLLIAFGVVGFFTKGINLGIDFKPGLIEEIRVAKPAITLTYSGNAKATVELSRDNINIIISGTGAENKTSSFSYAECAKIKDIVEKLNTIDNVKAVLNDEVADIDSFYMFLNSAVSTQLSNEEVYIYAKNTDATIDDVRVSLEDVKGVAVKELGTGELKSFQIRMAANSEEDTSSALSQTVSEKLASKFGAENIAVIKTDFIGSSFSKTLASKSLILLLFTVVLIWAYAAIRFHWDFALGSVIALIHDTLIMFTFIVWTQIEFTTTVLAAVLTIIGYSINATVVILDRVRYNLNTIKVTKFSELINASLSNTLGRSIITTVTTLFAVASLYIFTTGGIKDFALALIIGLISGCYSSIFISSGFICALRKNWRPEFGIHHSEKAMKHGELVMNSTVKID